MAIYTRFGGEVEITHARFIPVWVERTPDAIRWHYSRPKKTRAGAKIEEVPIWHYRGRYVGDSNPRHWHVCDGKWVDANSLKADGGWPEIEAKLIELCPDGPAKYREWNKAGAPAASHFFPPITEKEAA
jgi:hypothetical protein